MYAKPITGYFLTLLPRLCHNTHANVPFAYGPQPTPVFLDKAHQLYEMILVRHGLMLVGYSYGAKTAIYRVLAGALGDLEAAGIMEEHRWDKGEGRAEETGVWGCLVIAGMRAG